jgi:NAD(P)-dependent dehydrogenase (short-subunit alcohol dehydrogenase family)
MSDVPGNMNGKVCVITGALGLLGRELVAGLHAAGARIVVTDLDHHACVDRAYALGSDALGQGADITQPESIATLVAAVLDRFGAVDVLVNNAAIDDKLGGSHDGRMERFPLDAWKRSLDTNITGTFLCSQAFGSLMAARGKGSIINIASTYGVVAPDQSLYTRPDGTQPFYKSPAYPTTKAAVLGFTRYLAAYWGASGVRVNALSPGGIQAGQDPYFVERYRRRTPDAPQ